MGGGRGRGCGRASLRRAVYLWGLLICINASDISTVSAAPPTPAIAPVATTPPHDQRAILTLAVDDAPHGEAGVIIREKDILIPVLDLEHAGMQSFAGTREVVNGKTMVSLASLAPAITYKFDDQALTLSITAGADKMATHDLNLGLKKPADLEFRSDTSVFVNYSSIVTNLTSWNGFFEGGLSYKGGLFYSSLNASNGIHQFTRGLSNYTYDDQIDMRRIMVGDTFVSSRILGGGALLGGFSISKDFSLDPYFLRNPSQDISGILTTPSTVDIYRNGLLIKQEYLPPGSFNLNNIPIQVGQGNTQVVIRDALGNTHQIDSPYYLSPQLLMKGLSDYNYGVGFERNDLTSSFSYGAPALSAYHRYGLTNWLTVGGRFEAQRNLLSGGPSISVGSVLGEIDTNAALSRDQNSSGAAAIIAYQYLARRFSGGTSVQWMTSQYSNLSLKPTADRPLMLTQASGSVDLGYSSTLALQYLYERFTQQNPRNQVSVTDTTRIGRKINLILNATRGFIGNNGNSGNAANTTSVNEVFVGLSYFFGRDTVGTISGDSLDGYSSTVSLQKSLPSGPGYGYLLQAREGSDERENASFQYQTDYGRYQADYTRFAGENSDTLSIAGGLVEVDGHVVATRPVQNGFALVEVPGLADVPAEWSNQVIGKTNKAGNVLLPNLLPYYGNQVSIRDSSIPIDYSIEVDRKVISVPYRGGAIVSFPVHKVQQVTGTVGVKIGDRTVIPALGDLSVDVNGRKFDSPLGEKGQFYFDSIPAGRFPASIDFSSGTCKFEFEITKSDKPSIKLDEQTCVLALTASTK
jgi:outer membrane usher protein